MPAASLTSSSLCSMHSSHLASILNLDYFWEATSLHLAMTLFSSVITSFHSDLISAQISSIRVAHPTHLSKKSTFHSTLYPPTPLYFVPEYFLPLTYILIFTFCLQHQNVSFKKLGGLYILFPSGSSAPITVYSM